MMRERYIYYERERERTKGEGDTAVVLSPASDILIGITPQKIAQKTLQREREINE
jgi:hypothetical protein